MTDPYAANVILLVPCAFSGYASVFKDCSASARSVIKHGDAKIIQESATPYDMCGYFDGSGDYITIPDASSNFDLGTGDFTIECWCNCAQQTGRPYPALIANGVTFANGGFGIRFDNTSRSGKFTVHWKNVGDPWLTSSSTFAYNTLRHVELDRSGNNFKLYINGALEASATNSGSLNLSLGGNVYLCESLDGNNGYYAGKVYDYRVTKGVARHTSAFTPPGRMVDTLPTLPLNTKITRVTISPKTFGGTYKAVGAVTGVTGSRKVNLVHRATGWPIQQVWSDANTGAYEFDNLAYDEYMAYAVDYTNTFNVASADRLILTPM